MPFERLEILRADTVFALRQLRKHPLTSAAAILSLALGIGACTAAFRLIDAVLLRPLPVSHPEQLYSLDRQQIDAHGQPGTYDACEYPLFRRMRAAVADRAEVLAISPADSIDLTFGTVQETEKAFRQYVSGQVFASFGLRPAVGRLLTDADDRTPGAHPYAVLSYDYWLGRFGRDPRVVGRTFRSGTIQYEIIGVANQGFTGTDTGTITDVFVPTMMHPGVERSDWSWFRAWVRVKPGVQIAPLRDELQAHLTAFQRERLRGIPALTDVQRERFVNEQVRLRPAGAGVSRLQTDQRTSLVALGVLVALVLLIACANVANLLTARASSRERELAVRLSIGAGRGRLVQLVLVESACLALAATGLGAIFAWWVTPIVVSMLNPPGNPARLSLPADWRVLGFGLVLSLGVTTLFGLAPALRASSVMPARALKGGADARASRRTMHALIGAQVAFCVLVTFVAGLFVATFDRLSRQSNGFSADQLLTIRTVAEPAQAPVVWDQVVAQIRALPGVQSAAIAGWPLMSGQSWNGFIAVNSVRRSERLTFFLGVSPGWTETMGIPFVGGRDFRATDLQPGTAIVNETFVRTYLDGQPALGRRFEKADGARSTSYEIVGIVRDARYRAPREPMSPVAYVPLAERMDTNAVRPMARATFIVRMTSSADDPLVLASMLRHEITRARSELRVSAIETQRAINESHTIRERLMATLALFFAGLALVLSSIGVYGVLDYSVTHRRREIGIRLALGARASDIAQRVTLQAFAVVGVGALVGIGLGLSSARLLETLFYGVEATDPVMLTVPGLAIGAAALAAALRPVLRAVRIDPVTMLRAD